MRLLQNTFQQMTLSNWKDKDREYVTVISGQV